jgi:hypothetical protein
MFTKENSKCSKRKIQNAQNEKFKMFKKKNSKCSKRIIRKNHKKSKLEKAS